MAARAPEAGRSGFRFRRLDKPEEYRAAEELQRTALGEDAHLAVTAAVMRSLQDSGGLALGAFTDIYLAGVSVSSIGWDGSSLYHQLLSLAVRPEYRTHRVALRLLAFHRDEVLTLGLPEIRGSIDPLQSRAAQLALHRAGARSEGYRSNFFGRRTEGPSSDPETDRLLLRWKLQGEDVEARLSADPAVEEATRRRWSSSTATVETEVGESGLRVPTAVVEPTSGPVHLEIPFDLEALRTHEAAAVRRWRHAVRDAFRMALEVGYVADDFSVVSVDHERRAFYLLTPAPPSAPPA